MRHDHLSFSHKGYTLAAFVLAAFFLCVSVANAQDNPAAALVGTVTAKAIASLFLILVQVFNVVLGWAGFFFNFAMVFTVFEFSETFGNTEGLILAWSVLRDFANIALLFGFVQIGIMTILEVGKFDVKKALPALIIFGALLNFSLFAAEAVIDISNAFGSALYAQATSVDCRQTENVIDCQNQGIAASIFQVSGLSTMMNGGVSFDGIWNLDTHGVAALGMSFALLVFVITMIGVLVAGALMLVSRAITLVLLMVLSPIGFAGMAIPMLNKYSQDWWKRLIDNAIFAPVFVLLMLVGLKIVEGLRSAFVADGTSLLEAFSSSGGNVGGVMMLFAVAVGFMITALLSANYFAIAGSKQVVGGTLKFIGGTVGGMTAGTAALLGRQTVGRGAAVLARGVRSSSFARNNPFLGRMIAGGADTVSSKSFDIRSSVKNTGNKELDAALGALGAPTAAQKMGYTGVVKEGTEKRAKFGESLVISEKEQQAVKDLEGSAKENDKEYKRVDTVQKDNLTKLDARQQDEASAMKETLNNIERLQREAFTAEEKAQQSMQQALVAAIDSLKTRVAGAESEEERRLAQEDLAKKQGELDLLAREHINQLDTLRQQHERELAAQNTKNKSRMTVLATERATMIKQHEERLEGLRKRAQQDRKDAKNIKDAPKREYTDVLEKSWSVPGSAARQANKEAVKKLRKTLSKSEEERKSEKEADDFFKKLEKMVKDKDK